MQIKNKFVFYIFILLYISSSYLGVSHFHADTNQSHADCKICMVNSNLHNGDLPTTPSLFSIPTGYSEDFSLIPNFATVTIRKGFYSQAPPLYLKI